MAFQEISDRLIPIPQEVAPTTGSTVTVNSNGFVVLLINPAGSLLALTIALPSSPTTGDRVEISSTQAITTVTMSGGTISGALTTLAASGKATYVYGGSAATWFPL
jgi:hypothetical protein